MGFEAETGSSSELDPLLEGFGMRRNVLEYHKKPPFL